MKISYEEVREGSLLTPLSLSHFSAQKSSSSCPLTKAFTPET